MVSLTNFRSVGDLADVQDPQVGAALSHSLLDGHLEANQKHHKFHYSQQIATINEKQPSNISNNNNNNLSYMNEKHASSQHEHFEIRWSNLNYQVEPKWYQQTWRNATSSSSSSTTTPTRNVILNGLNGSVKSGQVTAILGPSGAGKTSLLGCLTGKNKSGVSGSVQVISRTNGRRQPMSICQIPQKDYLLNQLTVRENLWFASRLKHPTEGFDHDSNIDRVVDLLKLDTCIDTKISKISGGQYKRVSIAQELLSNPDILILDEPTSGLDSLTCYKTVMVLRDLARLSPNPMAILVTIHQPQREVFDLFNHVYILAVGGRCIYEGHPSQSIKTINSFGGGLHFDADQYNPASYLVEIASSEFGEKPIEALVEHQRRDFQVRIAASDQQLLDDRGGDHLTQPGQDSHRPAASPMGLKKRQSPMVARFKSTLSSLTGSSGSSPPPPQPPVGSNGQQHKFAYANQAYDVSQADVHGHGNFLEVLDARQLSHQIVPMKEENHRRAIITTADGELLEEGQFYLDERLQTHKHNHKGHFLRHCQLLTKRSWLCLCKDPMLTTLRFSAHIIVPLLITLVYGNKVGQPNACPLYESDMDLIDYARRGAKRLLNLQDELRCTFENVGLYFLSIYAFTFSTMCLTSLSFPLNMHVLLKEVRNGWYSIPTYFIGKTLADFPLEFILPTLTLMITYPLTGQPSSYMEWRFLLATSIFVVTSLIAQTQGLIFGALFMNAMQAAVFVAPVSTTPLILLSGFLIRISQMPAYLQKLSCLSYFRYAIESLTIIRYGFGQCPCDPTVVTGEPVSATGVPDQLRTMTNYWLSTFSESSGAGGADYGLVNDTAVVLNETTTESPQIDFFQDLTTLLARANSFGADIRTCKDLKPYPMIDFSLEDSQLYVWVAALVATLFLSKVVNYLVVKYSVKWRL